MRRMITVLLMLLPVALAPRAAAAIGIGLDAQSRSAAVATDDRLLPPTVRQIGTFAGVPYVQYDGIFEGQTTTGAFRVPYRIAAAADSDAGNGTVLVEPSHFATGLGARDLYLGPDFLFTRGFAHAGIGWSTTSFGEGFDRRILDPAVRGMYIEGGFDDLGGRTDHEIIVDFAHALSVDPEASSMLGRVARRYATGFSDSSSPVMDLITSGRARGVFDLTLPFTTEWEDPQPAIESRLYSGKLIIMNSEAEVSGNLVDRGVAPGQYRFYTVAGTPHVPDLFVIPFFSSGSTPASWVLALRAHFLQGDRWVRTGSAPPPSYHLKTSSGEEIARDENGNAIAVNARGQLVARLPLIELGEARFVTGFLGAYDNVKTITELGFATHPAYLKAFKEKLAAYLMAGHMLPEEAVTMRARAGLCPPLTYTQTYRDHYDNFVTIRACGG